MRTARSLTIGGGLGGVCPGGCLPRGVSARGCLPGEVPAQWGVPAQGGYHHPPPVDRQTLVKTQPSQTMFAGGNNPVSQKRNNTVTEFLAGRKGHIHCPRLEILISIGIVATTVYHWSTQYCYRSCNRNKMKK